MGSMDSTARASVPVRRAAVELIATAPWDE
jgi:hypothetical protein